MTSANDQHLVETKINSTQVYAGNFLKVLKDTVRLPNGNVATREYVVHPGAVVVIAMLDDGRIVLERQHRYPVNMVMIEFPAGKLEAGENPQFCGQRELLEETGYSASFWAYAGSMHLCIAYSTEIIHIFFAKGLKQGTRQLDDGESLDVFTMSPDELLTCCGNGMVTDAKTLTCVLWLQNVLSNKWQLEWLAATEQDFL
ncbi:MAG TPA: NUDIX hydrolase [Burkholderiaceae bacterium]|nr:NUDIX hydrolase [Burkholderiaceae bacterium]